MQILKKITMLAFLLSAFAVGAMAQLTGTKTIPGTYATVAAAVTDLNTQGVGAGGVTFVVADGYTETAPAGGYTITNPTGNGAGNPIVFRRATNTGTRPAFTASAAQTSGSLTDAIFKIVGTDNLTIDGFSMLENAANTTTAAATNNMTEFGVALFYATTTNGSQNVTVQNCIIDLDRTYPNTFGVYSNSTTSATAATTSATATTTDGGNSGLKLYANSITDVNIGIVVIGPTAATDLNEGLDIGGTAMATGNSVTNYGTNGTFSSYANVSGTVNGILVRNTRNYNVSYNSIVSSNGGTTAGTLRGIYVPAFSAAPTGTLTNSVNNNNVSVRSGVLAGAVQGIIIEGTTTTVTSTTNINNNDFNNSGHTIAAATGAITFISNLGIAQNTNITNNTFTNMSVNTTGSVTFLSNSWSNPTTGGIKNVNGNSVVTAFSKTGAGGTITWFTDNGSDVAGTFNNSNNNNFSNITATGATTILGLSNTNGGSPVKSVTGNTMSNWTGGTSALTGMVVSFSGAATVTNNAINTMTCACTLVGLSTASGGSTAADNFSQNTIHTLSSSGALGVTGIVNSGGTTRNIFRNKIYNLENTNAGGTVNGVTISGGTTINLYNNLIGDLRASAATSATTPVATDVIRGINITATTTLTTINVSFNTVYLNATSTGANFSTAALFATTSATSTSATLNLRNNILVNLSTPAGTGVTTAYRRSSADLTNYGAASNNNDFFAGTPSATRLIFFDGTNSDQTLAAYKARVSPRDSASVSENPNFVSTTGANAGFLHISTVTPTQLESGGIPVSGITDDYDGETRNTTTPDIGADEFAGTALDLNPPVISYTPVGNTASTANRTITVTITDPSGVAGGANSPRIYFRKNGGAYSSTQCVLTSGSSYTCTIDYSLVGGVTNGDVIDYFVVAQDTNGNVGANPGGGFSATNVNNVTSPPTTPNTYTIVAGFPASVTVGTGGTYTSLTNAGGVFAALNAGVITGSVTINITSDLTAETGAVALNQSNEEGAGAGTYTVTIKPSGAARNISGTSTTALITLNGADRVTIDGALSGGTDRSLTITNTSTSTANVGVILISSSTSGAQSDTVKNVNVVGNAAATITTLSGIHVGGATVGSLATTPNTNITIDNNSIQSTIFGITSLGVSAAAKDTGTVVTGNTMTGTGNNRIGRIGMYIIYTDGLLVSRNSISGILNAESFDAVGIAIGQQGISTAFSAGAEVSNATISRNNVGIVQQSNTYSAAGIVLGSSTTGTNTVVNNMVSGVIGNGTTGDFVTGIYVGAATGGTQRVLYNSVSMTGDRGATASQYGSFALSLAGADAPVDVRNNILYNTQTQTGGGAGGNSYAYGIGYSTFANLTSNYNDLYVSGAQGVVGLTGALLNTAGTGTGTEQPTLAAFQTATGKDANSRSVDPLFVSTTNLHLQTTSPVRGAATPIAGITNDFDNDNRNPTTPDIGADEVTSFVFPTVQFSSATYTGAEGTSATVTVTRTGDTTVASTVNYATTDGTATGGAACGTAGVDYQTATGTLSFAAGDMNKTFNVVLCSDAIIKGGETVNLTLSAPTNATLGTPSTSVLTITNVNPPMPGTLALSAATYSVNEAAGNLTVTVNRTGGTDGAVGANYSFTNGTATGGATCAAGVDFINTGGTVSFASGEAVKTFTVAICNDTAFEGNETFNVTLSGATGGATIGTPSSAVVTILDDEVAQPGTLQFNPATYTVSEAGPTVTLTVTRTGGTDGAVGANYSFTNGTATGGATCAAGVDFINTGGTISFANGETSKTIVVTICNDTVFEGDEAFTATLASPTGGATLGTATATVTITDDEVAQNGTLALSAATYTVAENVGGGTLTVTVNRTGGTDGAVTATYALTNGTATGGATCAAGVDFINTGGTVSFANGETSKSFTVTICNDTVFEGNETFNVTLSNATGGATIGTPSSAVITITDDEVAQNGTVQFSAATYTVTEAGPTATITITRTGGSDGAITVNYATVTGGTATGAAACAAGVDYVNTSGTATFAAGVTTSQTFTIPICNDTVPESSETVNLALTAPTGGATLGTPNTAVLTITDDDVLTGPVTVAATAGTASASYNNLTEAAAAINAGTHQGAIIVSINQSITEPAAVVINGSGAGAAVYTSILIRPTVDNISDSGPTVTGRGLIELNGADNVTIDGDNPNSTGTNRNLTLQNTAANTVTFTSVIRVAVAASGVTSADGNTFRNLNVLGSATGRNVSTATSTTGSENTTFGIFAGPGASTTDATAAPAAVTSVSTAVATGATATNLLVNNNSFGTAARAVTMNGSATTVFSGLQITGNSIGNPTAGDADQIYAVGITAQGSDNGVISNNTVYIEGYLTTALQGINVGVNSATGTFTIERNMVNRVRNSNGTIYGAYGINLGGGLNHVVQNNFVSGVINNQTAGTAGFGTTFGANGIRSGGGTGHKIYHNSVNLYGAIPGALSTNLTAAFLISATTQTGLDVRNNIFSNQLTGGNPTGTRNVAIYLPSGGTSTMNLTLNNNAYYAGMDANNRLAQVGATFGTGEYQVADFSPAATTPATNFRAYSSTLSAAGTNDNASFASSAPPPFTSNVNLHIPAGTATRLESGGAAVGVTTDIDLETRSTTTPDIGADEFGGQPAPANDIAAVAFVNPTNGSTVPTGASFTPQASFLNNGTATQTNVTVRYRITNSSNVVIYNQTATIATIAPLQIVTVSFPATTLPAAGTYTIQASAELAGDANTANDSITGSINAVNPLGGTISVGTGETYTSLTNAGGIFQALNAAGISGNTVINITSDLTAETGAVALNQLSEVGAGGYTVTFKPSGAARTVSGTAAALSMIKLNGADRVIFDGSLNGGTDRSLTFLYTNTGGTVFWLASASTTNGSNNNTIKNCIIASNPGTVSIAGILAGSGTTLGGAAESPNSNNTVQNNQIFRVQNSLFLFGNATAANLDQNWVVANNEFSSTTTADKNSFRGMLIGNSQNFSITGNSVLGLRSAATTTAATTGIQLAGLVNGGSVVKNKITDVKNVSTSGTGAFGMQISATSTASNVTIANNFISDVAANGSATVTSNGFGMTFNGSGTGYNVYYNSINLNTDQTTAQTSAALFVNSTFATAGALDVRNNNFVNTQTTGARYAVYSLAAASVFTTINYNDYFAQNVGFIGGTPRPTLADWQAGTGQDANSKAVDPLFVSATDLHLQATSPVLDSGTPIASVTDDIDGQTRSTTTPDIGADEVVAAPQNGMLALSASTYTVSEAATSLTVTVNRTGGTSGAVTVNYTLGGGTATGGATCAAGVDYINTGGTVNFADGQASQTFTVTLCPDSLNKTDETFNVTLSGATGGATIGTPATAVVTITNDDPQPTISINSVSQNEGNSGTTPFVFTVTLSAASGQTVTVNYFTADGTATAPSDYTAIPNTVLTFAPGETTKSVTVLVNGDTTPEANETFTVNLATPTNATIATAQGIGTIVNDDAALPSLTINDVRVVEGNSGTVNAVFTVTLSAAATTPVSVAYATANGTATAGSDYVATNGTLNFAVGQTTQTITVVVNGDLIKEANETFFVNLSNASGATIADNQGVGIIIDNDRAIRADFDRDRKTDVSVFRPSNGYWYVLQSSNNLFNPMLFGQNGDLPVPGDYDGDGSTDYAVFRPSNGSWYIQRSSDFAIVSTQFGFGSDKPVQGDYDGDGKTDIAVFRPSTGTWYILQSSTGNQFTAVAFGISSDVPVQGDYDGDAKTDVAVYRSGVWYVLNSSNGAVTAINYGAASDKPLVGDFDGDGKADYTVYRAGVWYIFQTLTQTSRGVPFGASSDIPVVGDYDGDGTSDIAVFRGETGYWYVLQSSNGGFSSTLFGQQNDIPIPAGYQSLQ